MIQLADIDLVIPPIRKGDGARGLLAGINLTLSERRVAAIGINGLGKSSLLRPFNDVRRLTPDTVSVKDHDVAEESRGICQLVGFIFVGPLAQLLIFTPIEDLTLSFGYLPRKGRTDRTQQILDRRGLGHLVHQNIYDLFGGERQMAVLTNILTVRPEVIVADESTTLLDLRNKLALRHALAELEQQVIYSTHDMDVAVDADRMIIIEGGRVIADDEPGEVIT